MTKLHIQKNALGFEVWEGPRLVALYRATEELPRTESPKPCFAPIYTPVGELVTEYRPADHPWHTGLYFGWVFANKSNLWGGPWYLPDKGNYEMVSGTHGVQRHDGFLRLEPEDDGVVAEERLSWLDGEDNIIAVETRTYEISPIADPSAYCWHLQTRIKAIGGTLTLGSSRKSHYSGLELRMGPPFADVRHRNSEGAVGHESIMGTRARWVSATGVGGGEVIMMDHPENPRHPVTWFTRKNLLGAGLLMEKDFVISEGECLELCYGFYVLANEPSLDEIDSLYKRFLSGR